jgi:hypothetical protein
MPKSRIPAVAVLAAALLVAAPGCEGVSGGFPGSRELTSAQFDDIPVPRGFAIDLAAGRSYSYAEGGGGPGAIRMGRLEYTGLGDPDELVGWYAVEMPRPMHGWSSGEPHPDRPNSMIFRRGGEVCLVSARAEGAQVRVVIERNTGGAIGRE